MDRIHLDTFGYCRGPVLEATWPDREPGAPVRDVLAAPGWLRDLAVGAPLRALASLALGAAAHPVRANLFAKSVAANWGVPWHQDRAVCVQQREAAPGFSGWSVKAGLAHTNAPAYVLRGMVALRLHLDPCPADAGPLEVVPGSHREVLASIDPAKMTERAVTLPARSGEVLAIRPLLVHRSMATQRSFARRVLHVEYAAASLPAPLRWHYGPAPRR
ncbi:MAG: phytanoyl-CoA dioxygenase family protein [Planctomycetota bacterium]